MYNVLEKLHAGGAIEGKDKEVYEQGLIGILKQIHDEIDVAVANAYGWPADLSGEEILERLVALNRERAMEEASGKILWRRPEYQNPTGEAGKVKSGELELDDVKAAAGKHPWPKALPQQMAMVRAVLSDLGQASVEDVRSQFVRGQTKTVKECLETLAALGQAQPLDDGRYAA
jgi:hypothetical protein